MAGAAVVIGHTVGEASGELVVGRDQVCVGPPGFGTYLPIRGITWIHPARD